MDAATVTFPKMPIEHGIAIPKPQATQHAKLQKQAQRFVAQTFYGTLLKQMRQSPFRDPRFDGGRGGEAFNEMLDQHLSERMAGGTNNKLVHAIAQKLDLQRPRDAHGNYIRDQYKHHNTSIPPTATPASVHAASSASSHGTKLDVTGA